MQDSKKQMFSTTDEIYLHEKEVQLKKKVYFCSRKCEQGTQVPSFIGNTLRFPTVPEEQTERKMIDKLYILDIIDQALKGTDKYLVDLKITTDNRIYVSIDSDNAVLIDDCVDLSRRIENSLNRDEEDFELNVASAGLDSPLRLARQYKKNVGQELTVTTFEGETVEGRLTEANDTHITLQKPGKKKAPVEPVEIAYSDIKTAKIIIKF